MTHNPNLRDHLHALRWSSFGVGPLDPGQPDDQPGMYEIHGAGMRFKLYTTAGLASVATGHLESLREHVVFLLDALATELRSVADDAKGGTGA